MGIIPHGESPWGWAPTIRFGMAVDAISVLDTCYLTAVRYYLANLGTTLESQVTSSVAPPTICLSHLQSILFLIHLPSLRLAVCRASLSVSSSNGICNVSRIQSLPALAGLVP